MRLALLATIALTLSAISPAANAANWPNWRGPTQNGVSTEKGIPAEFGPGKNVAWQVKLPGPGGASPVVWGDQVYVTSVDGQKLLLQAWSTGGKLRGSSRSARATRWCGVTRATRPPPRRSPTASTSGP